MKTPVHLWIVGIVSLLWNAFGGYDYVMTRTGNATYLANYPPEALAMIESGPLLFDIGWALGVWAAIAGSLLLLARSRWAGPAFALSLLGIAMASIWSYVLAEASTLQLVGTGSLVLSAVIVLVTVALWAYARAMTARGALR